MAYTLDDWFNYFFEKTKLNKSISLFNVARFSGLHQASSDLDPGFTDFLRLKRATMHVHPVYDIEIFETQGVVRTVKVQMRAPFAGVLYTNEYMVDHDRLQRSKLLHAYRPVDDQIVANLARHLRRYHVYMFGEVKFGVVRFHHFRANGDKFHFLDNPLFVTWFASAGIIALRGDSGPRDRNEFLNWNKVYKGAFWAGFTASQFFRDTGRKIEKAPMPHNVTKEFVKKVAHVNWSLWTRKDMELIFKIYRGALDVRYSIFSGFHEDLSNPGGCSRLFMSLDKASMQLLITSIGLLGFSDRFVSFIHRLKTSGFDLVQFDADGCSPEGWPTVDDDKDDA